MESYFGSICAFVLFTAAIISHSWITYDVCQPKELAKKDDKLAAWYYVGPFLACAESVSYLDANNPTGNYMCSMSILGGDRFYIPEVVGGNKIKFPNNPISNADAAKIRTTAACMVIAVFFAFTAVASHHEWVQRRLWGYRTPGELAAHSVPLLTVQTESAAVATAAVSAAAGSVSNVKYMPARLFWTIVLCDALAAACGILAFAAWLPLFESSALVEDSMPNHKIGYAFVLLCCAWPCSLLSLATFFWRNAFCRCNITLSAQVG